LARNLFGQESLEDNVKGGTRSISRQVVAEEESHQGERKLIEVEKHGRRRFRTKINDSETLILIKKRNICFDKFHKIDKVFKSNDGRVTKGSGSNN